MPLATCSALTLRITAARVRFRWRFVRFVGGAELLPGGKLRPSLEPRSKSGGVRLETVRGLEEIRTVVRQYGRVGLEAVLVGPSASAVEVSARRMAMEVAWREEKSAEGAEREVARGRGRA